MLVLAFMAPSAFAQLTQITFGIGNEYHPKWSPDGETLAYTLRNSEGNSLWSMPASGGNSVSFEVGYDGDLSFDWSPDGTHLVFDAYPDNEPPCDLFLFDIANSETHQLTNYVLGDNHPCFSPDGTMIAFSRGGEIHTMPVTGGTAERLTTGYDAWHPSWSPDGTTIAFTSDMNGNADIYTVPADGGTVTQLIDNPTNDDRAAWSPDGSMIAFTSERSGNTDVWIKYLAGDSVKQITTNPAFDSHPYWSPDGRKIAFASLRNMNFDIFVLDLNPAWISLNKPEQPETSVLIQNVPNPFRDKTEFRFYLESKALVSIMIYDQQGRLVRKLIENTECRPGDLRVSWDGTATSSNTKLPGIYHGVITINNKTYYRKLVLMIGS